jgi:PhnB protein
MKAINPYLRFNDESQEAFNFYKSVFGGEFTTVQRFKDIPEQDKKHGNIQESEGEKIMHIALPIGNNVVLMASDAPKSIDTVKVGDNFSISIEAESKEEADRLFKGLSAGGKVAMGMMDMFWGSYYGMFQDKFGVGWMINYTYPNPRQ